MQRQHKTLFRFFVGIIILGIACFLLFNLFLNNSKREITKSLGINASSGKVLYHKDTHGGFHGDGDTVTVLKFPDDSYSKQIKDEAPWHSFPVSYPMETKLYGLWDVSPIFVDENGKNLLPKLEHGFYYFKNRHSEGVESFDESTIWSNLPSNYTIAVYDLDTNTLYYRASDI